jgi:hypothetical protein
LGIGNPSDCFQLIRMIPRRHIWTTALLLGATAPLAGLMYWANVADNRSASNLELADRCVDWAHKNQDARALDGPEIAAKCDRYFHARSDKDADEDDRRWAVRAAHAPEKSGRAAGSND